MKTYMMLGIKNHDLEKARRAVEAAVGIQMQLHESSYRCGEYYRSGSTGGENFILQRNFDQVEGEWTEPKFSEYNLLLYVSETVRDSEIVTALSGIGHVLSTHTV